MPKIRHAIILAAGRGQRMMPLTDSLPKPMAPYNGSTLIAQGIAEIKKKIHKVHVTVGYKKAMLAQHVIEHGATSVFNTEGQSNSWWLYNTLLRDLNEPICVLTCDNVVDIDVDLLEDDYFGLGQPAGMLVPVVPVPGLEGDYIFHHNHVVSEVNREKPSQLYCSGIQVLNPFKINQLTKELGDFYSVWNQLIGQQQLFVSSVYPKRWFSVDTVEHLEMLQNLNISV